ncbi:MAG: hypothetical protein AAF617_16365, partial [Bacteroidota bacterium]
MKKIYVLFFLCLLVQWTQAQIVNIPDVNFKNALINTNCVDFNDDGILDGDADTNDDGEIQLSEAAAITGIEILISSVNYFDLVGDLTGIDAFVNLKNLTITPHRIDTADVSQNTALESINFTSGNLDAIDLSSLVNLKKLAVGDNLLVNLDVSQNLNLESLEIWYNVYLTSIDVSQNTNLKTFSAIAMPLASLDVSQNINLETITVSMTNVISLDLRNNSALDYIEINGNENLDNVYIKNGSIASFTQIGTTFQPVQYVCVDSGEASIFDNKPVSQQALIDSNCASFAVPLSVADTNDKEDL